MIEPALEGLESSSFFPRQPARNINPHQFGQESPVDPAYIPAPGGSGFIHANDPVAKWLNKSRNLRSIAQTTRGGQHNVAEQASAILREASPREASPRVGLE